MKHVIENYNASWKDLPEEQKMEIEAWERFACSALSGLLAEPELSEVPREIVVRSAADFADMMMEERKICIGSLIEEVL